MADMKTLVSIAGGITLLAVIVLAGLAIVHQMSISTGNIVSEDVTNETQHVDYETATLFDNAGEEYECTLGNVYYDDTPDVLLSSVFYLDQSPLCAIQGTETYNFTYEDCLQQLATANDTLGDGDCYQSDEGTNGCEPPASDNCEQTDNESWYDLDWDTTFDMYPNGTAGWDYVTTFWDYPNADTINGAVWEVKYDPVLLDDPILENYTIPAGCLLETGIQTYVLVNQSGAEDWKLQCANNESGFTTLANGTYDEFYLHEQEIWWEVTNAEPNPYTDADWLINYEYTRTDGGTTILEGGLNDLVGWIPVVIVIVLGGLAVAYITGRKSEY